MTFAYCCEHLLPFGVGVQDHSLVMEAGLEEVDSVVADEVNNSVLLVQAPRPCS